MATKESWSGKISRKLIKKQEIIDVAAGRKKADLVLFKGHPFETFSKVLFTMIDGEIVYRDAEMYL